MTVEVSGLVEVMSWVMDFGRHAAVMESAHLREAVAQQLAATAGDYAEESATVYREHLERRTSRTS